MANTIQCGHLNKASFTYAVCSIEGIETWGGARKLIAQALKAEVAELVGTYTHLQDGRGHAAVVLATGSARAGDSEGD